MPRSCARLLTEYGRNCSQVSRFYSRIASHHSKDKRLRASVVRRSRDGSRRYSHIAQRGLVSIKHPPKIQHKLFLFPSGTSAGKALTWAMLVIFICIVFTVCRNVACVHRHVTDVWHTPDAELRCWRPMAGVCLPVSCGVRFGKKWGNLCFL